MAMTRQQFAKQLQDGLNAIFGISYDRHTPEWTELFEQHTSQKAYEEDVQMVGLGGALEKAEGAMIQFDAGAEGYVARYDHTTIGIGFAITEEAVEDGRYGSISAKYTKSLARSMQYTKEIRGADIYNTGFSTTYGDGQYLLDTDHPLWAGGTLANELSTAADLSEDSLEDICILIEGWTDDRGIPIKVMPTKLIIPRQQMFIAERLFATNGRVGTADNDINAMKKLNSIPGGYTVNHYLTDTDAWFVRTDAPDGLKHFKRRGIKKGMEVDFRSGNMNYKASERYSFGVTDWRGIAGSPGA